MSKEELKVGDIISFYEGSYINTHRFVRIENQSGEEVYITKGDNNEKEDKLPVKFKNIEGKYILNYQA